MLEILFDKPEKKKKKKKSRRKLNRVKKIKVPYRLQNFM